MASSAGSLGLSGGKAGAAGVSPVAADTLPQEALERIFKFTRFPRDKEAILKPSLGLPAFDPAPLDENEAFPETLNTVDPAGFVEPAPRLSNNSEYGSFLVSTLKHNANIVQGMAERVDAMFDEWEEERSKEVVYRMDGLKKFFRSVVVTDNEQELERFLDRVISDEESFAHLVESAIKIPVRTVQPRHQRAAADPLTRDLCGRTLSPLHAGWWVRLTQLKSREQSGASAYTQAAWSPSLRDADSSKQAWTGVLSGLIFQTVSEIAEPRGQRPKMRIGLNRNTPDPDRRKTSVASISARQLTSRNKLNESKLEQFEYLWELARSHFEAGLIIQDRFLRNMVESVMGRMHMEATTGPTKWKGPLPLFVCYLFVSKLARLAPFMNESVLRQFWLHCTYNLRALYWAKGGARSGSNGDAPSPEGELAIEHDVAFDAYADILQGAIRFVAVATPPKIFRSWERDLQVPGSLSRSPSSAGGRSASGLSSDRRSGGQGQKNQSQEVAPTWWAEAPTPVGAGASSSGISGSSGAPGDSSAAGGSGGGGSATSPMNSVPGGGPFGAQQGNEDGVFPLCTTAGAMSAEQARLPPTAPAGIATAASVRSLQPGSVTLNFAARARGRKRRRQEMHPNLDPWLKFELIPNTPSLHYLLRGARKVRRPQLHPTQFGIMRSSSLQSTTSSSSTMHHVRAVNM